MKDKATKSQIILTAVVIVLGIIIGFTTVLLCFFYMKNKSEVAEQGTISSTAQTEVWQEGDVSYNGKVYRFNPGAKAYLFMGIDQDEPAHKSANYNEGGSCDALFLVVLDSTNKKTSIIAINRGARVNLNVIDEMGMTKANMMGPICLQHAYGDGMKVSCQNTVKTVSKLFRNIPISGYLSIQRGAVPALNDSIGGVTVTIDDTETGDKTLIPGTTVKLTGSQARSYLVGRADSKMGATERLNRQMQYISAYISQAKAYAAGDMSKATAIYNKLEPYIVSSMDVPKFIEDMNEYGYDASNMKSVPGEVVLASEYENENFIQGPGYAEYIVDEDGLFELILDVFYDEVSTP